MVNEPTSEELEALAADGDQVVDGVSPPTEKQLKEALDAARNRRNKRSR